MTDLARCPWCGTDPLYVAYHDSEWGIPEHDPRALWECLMLEAFQAGLSWITILRRRETFRAAFAGFDPAVVATWGEAETLRLLQDPGIIRHRGKIAASVTNAEVRPRVRRVDKESIMPWPLAACARVGPGAVIIMFRPSRARGQSAAMPSTTARNMSARVCVRFSPKNAPRAWGSWIGVRSPEK